MSLRPFPVKLYSLGKLSESKILEGHGQGRSRGSRESNENRRFGAGRLLSRGPESGSWMWLFATRLWE